MSRIDPHAFSFTAFSSSKLVEVSFFPSSFVLLLADPLQKKKHCVQEPPVYLLCSTLTTAVH